MGPDDPVKWAASFALELMVGGQRVPFERVLARHCANLATLRQTGLTWSGIAALLADAGARRFDGRQISADQVRVGYARLAKDEPSAPVDHQKKSPRHVRKKPMRSASLAQSSLPVASVPLSECAEATSQPPSNSATGQDDLSADDLSAALDRLNKIK
jgi:hypothetical protein